MAKEIRSRNSDQCRGHHQKYIERYNSIDGIIETLKVETNNPKIKEQGLIKHEEVEHSISLPKEEKPEIKTMDSYYKDEGQVIPTCEKIVLEIPMDVIPEW